MCVHVYVCKSVSVSIMLYTIMSIQRQREVGRSEVEKRGKKQIELMDKKMKIRVIEAKKQWGREDVKKIEREKEREGGGEKERENERKRRKRWS